MKKQNRGRAVPHTMSITELSQNASGAVDRAIDLDDQLEPLIIMRHNKPVAVLLGIKAYEELYSGFIENETEIAYNILKQRGIAREDIAAHLESQRNAPKYTLEEVMAMFGDSQEELDAVSAKYGNDL